MDTNKHECKFVVFIRVHWWLLVVNKKESSGAWTETHKFTLSAIRADPCKSVANFSLIDSSHRWTLIFTDVWRKTEIGILIHSKTPRWTPSLFFTRLSENLWWLNFQPRMDTNKHEYKFRFSFVSISVYSWFLSCDPVRLKPSYGFSAKWFRCLRGYASPHP